MNIPVREPQDDTVARLAPEPCGESELCVDLKDAYLEEKILSQQLEALSGSTEAGWDHPHADRVSSLATEDGAHIRALLAILAELDTFPPERPETAHPLPPKRSGVRTILQASMDGKKDLEIRYIRAASLAAVEGRRALASRLEGIADEEARGRRNLLQVLSRFPANQPED
jgi:hypothetical protein